jgi:hypothetical protein
MNPTKPIGFFIIALLLFVFVTAFKCGGGYDEGVYGGVLYSNHTLLTPAGATIASRNSIDPAFGPLIDAGIEDVNRIASAPPNNYDVSDLPASRYRVWLFPRSPLCENPAFLVNATGSPYEGTEWDKDPRPDRCTICAAGLTIFQGFPQPTGPGMVITDDVGIMRTIVRYEAEHSILFYKDGERFNATQYHTNGQGHPILGEGPPVGEAKVVRIPEDIVVPGGERLAVKGKDACIILTK